MFSDGLANFNTNLKETKLIKKLIQKVILSFMANTPLDLLIDNVCFYFNILLLIEIGAQVKHFLNFSLLFFISKKLFELTCKFRIIIIDLIMIYFDKLLFKIY